MTAHATQKVPFPGVPGTHLRPSNPRCAGISVVISTAVSGLGSTLNTSYSNVNSSLEQRPRPASRPHSFSRPNSLPVLLLTKCTFAQAWQKTASYWRCSASWLSFGGNLLCTLAPVAGHRNVTNLVITIWCPQLS